jgi:membrane protease YdiL (CAAX protease family)
MGQAAALPPALDELPLKRRQRREVVEIALAYGMILLVIWTPPPWQRLLWYASAAVITSLIALRFESWNAMGVRWGNLLRSSWVVAVALAVAAAILLAAARFHTLRLPQPFHLVDRYAGYALWACAQQLLLQGFFMSRIVRVMKPGQAVVAAAILFAAAHVPNPLLVPLTLLWGLIACLHFLRYRNLIPLAVAHAILGIVLTMTLPGPEHRAMRVGLGYLRLSDTSTRSAAPVRGALAQP